MGGVFNHINGNLYHYAANNPVRYVDPDGRDIFAVGALIVWGFNATLLGYGLGSIKKDEYGFIFRHPVVAAQIGEVKVGRGCTNISTNSARFAAAVGNDDFFDGGQVNAIRHVLWSSAISSKFGVNIAKEATDSHERNPELKGFLFSNIIDADLRCDLLNKEIGIALGKKKSSMKNLTKEILDIFHSEGLWVSSQNENGDWIVSRLKMLEEDYNKAVKNLEKCNENGFRPGEKYYE